MTVPVSVPVRVHVPALGPVLVSVPEPVSGPLLLHRLTYHRNRLGEGSRDAIDGRQFADAECHRQRSETKTRSHLLP